MLDIASIVAIGLGVLALVIAVLGWFRGRAPGDLPFLNREQAADLFRDEHHRLRGTLDEQFRGVREELGGGMRGLQESNVRSISDLGKALEAQTTGIGGRVDAGAKRIEDQSQSIREKLDAELKKMAEDATTNRDQLRTTIEGRLDQSATAQTEAAKIAHENLLKGIADQGKVATDLLDTIGRQQKERLDTVSSALADLTKQQDEKLEAVRKTVEERLDTLRNENSAKLDEMRQTVDEKLHTTLETRLGESFNRVVEQLKLVSEGIGEMKSLASGVGDLKKVLSNVSVRGALGEIQLARLLEQLLSPEQYIENAAVKENSQERVEFAIRLPGQDGENEVLLPIDAKFPQEDYLRLQEAAENGDADGVAAASANLETRVRQFAQAIRSKYIVPPRTTDFAILFLPTEGLYAEVLRRPGLFERLQREHNVTLAGPTTLTALLNALQVGFRSLAIQKRSSEVWQVLGAVRTEFGKYNAVVEKLGKQLGTAANSVEALGQRTRAMNRKLREVETLPAAQAEALLGFNGDAIDEPEDAEEVQEA